MNFSFDIPAHLLSTKVIFNGKLLFLQQKNDDTKVLFTKENTK